MVTNTVQLMIRSGRGAVGTSSRTGRGGLRINTSVVITNGSLYGNVHADNDITLRQGEAATAVAAPAMSARRDTLAASL